MVHPERSTAVLPALYTSNHSPTESHTIAGFCMISVITMSYGDACWSMTSDQTICVWGPTVDLTDGVDPGWSPEDPQRHTRRGGRRQSRDHERKQNRRPPEAQIEMDHAGCIGSCCERFE